jgi:CRP/FNR family transcriptional regulator
MFGNISLSGFKGEEFAVALVNNTIVYCFDINEFRALLKGNHRPALNYAEAINSKLSRLREKYEIWIRYDTKTRLVYFLRKWAEAEGKDNGTTIVLTNYLSLTDMADILSVSRQFMYTLLKEMNETGLIRYNRRHIGMCKCFIKGVHPN